jgi:hypothetical protein
MRFCLKSCFTVRSAKILHRTRRRNERLDRSKVRWPPRAVRLVAKGTRSRSMYHCDSYLGCSCFIRVFREAKFGSFRRTSTAGLSSSGEFQGTRLCQQIMVNSANDFRMTELSLPRPSRNTGWRSTRIFTFGTMAREIRSVPRRFSCGQEKSRQMDGRCTTRDFLSEPKLSSPKCTPKTRESGGYSGNWSGEHELHQQFETVA